jgi:hypothetical protein
MKLWDAFLSIYKLHIVSVYVGTKMIIIQHFNDNTLLFRTILNLVDY